MSDLDQEIGKRLRVARKSRGYKSARTFAIEQQIPESTYSQHETGKRSLSPETTLRYCACLGIEPGWLLTGQEASAGVSQENESVPEATLNASYRQSNNQQIENASAKMTDDHVSINMDVFRGVLHRAITRFLNSETKSVNVDELIAYCFGVYNGLVKMPSQYKSAEVEQPK